MSDYYSILQSMFVEYLNVINMINIIVIGGFGVFMWRLFREDSSSYKDGPHKDFKSILVSTGVLGTFVGIVIGLWNFNSGDIAKSVPQLLGGLKTAFLTSIFGMVLAIRLSVIQKRKGGNVAEDEITALNNINKQLEKLDRLENIEKYNETLPLIKEKLDSIDTNMEVLSTDISSVKEELKINQNALFGFLKTKLAAIDNSLKEAVQTLSKGATEEIIKALEGVIQDFNKNLTEQFGDNFKQLNESVLRMIEWQDNYKDAVQGFEQQLKRTTENTTNLIEKFINKNQKENDKIKERLKELFKQTKTAVSTTKSNAEQIAEITDDYTRIAVISKNLEAVITTNQNQIENLETHLRKLAEIGEDAGGITTELASFSKEIQGSLSNQAEALAELTAGIEAQLPASLDALNTSLTSLTTQFSKDYGSFLEQVSKLMQANNIN